jgi:hypothetical protein
MSRRFLDAVASGAVRTALGRVWRNQSKAILSACAAVEVQECEDDGRLFFVSPFKSVDTDF